MSDRALGWQFFDAIVRRALESGHGAGRSGSLSHAGVDWSGADQSEIAGKADRRGAADEADWSRAEQTGADQSETAGRSDRSGAAGKGTDTAHVPPSDNPWSLGPDGEPRYRPDFATLGRLLGVPLFLGAPPTSGVPALALDVWLVYELQRAGFDPDAVWPRPSEPRILPGPIAELLRALPRGEAEALRSRLATSRALRSAAPSEARILGKHYEKQVDVVMSDWATGPELMISTKRMDSSFGKNAPNRVEEAYGDAKNLRSRHPLAALGFFFGIRSTVFDEAPGTAEWMIDLMGKLGQEDDAYRAVCLLPMEYADAEPAAPERIEQAAAVLAAAAATVAHPGGDASAGDAPSNESPRDALYDGTLLDQLGLFSDDLGGSARPTAASRDAAAGGGLSGAPEPGGAARFIAENPAGSHWREGPGHAADEPAQPATARRGVSHVAGEAEASSVSDVLAWLPDVAVREDLVPLGLRSATFLEAMIRHVLSTTPVTLHRRARELLKTAREVGDVQPQ
ncbi:MAG: hypothetical protein Q3979_03100 [Actinomycetaceae bacterium]|nr:hypothetical protein [Actinomycetaceae bacterium]